MMNFLCSTKISVMFRIMFIISAVLGFAACSSTNINSNTKDIEHTKRVNSSTPLEGTWQLVSVNSKPMENYAYFTVTGTEISGNNGCNSFGASFNEPSVKSTRIGCEGRVSVLPDFYYLSTHPESYTINGDTLSIQAHGSQPAYVFKRVPDKKQANTEKIDLKQLNKELFESTWQIVLVASKPVKSQAFFKVTGTEFYGNDGCNDYGTRRHGLEIGVMVSIVCPEGFIGISPDLRYMSEHPESYTINGDTLSIQAHGSQPAYVFKRIKDKKKQ